MKGELGVTYISAHNSKPGKNSIGWRKGPAVLGSSDCRTVGHLLKRSW